ncbi:FecR family protein [Flavobacterium pectinovorum]|uniref:FecR family protein n=1 Tax=Flavobacterium pectinovorum TaxID=29533 RepID=A0AB36NXD4_9FLAO|nr:FecR family protein [Flavobacterium pectinovorum]OXB00923.1 iron dicitrate transport regulator FecR [Flavobacterium pectinovorum]SHN18284.1 FecR family protein [Flavobacterium pectinovorum]
MISEILHKYLSNEASEQEIQTLFEWIDASEENKKQFINLKKTWAITSLSEGFSSEAIPVISIKKKNKLTTCLKFAAVFLVLFGLAKLAFNYSQKTASLKEIVLELADGSSELITSNNQSKVVNDKGDLIAKKFPNQIIYFGKVQDQEVVYNTLKVPYGKRFKLQLSDGTVVSLNSGTTFKYPEQFGVNGKRNVYLTGEAFFEVAKDKTHPFIVHANKVEVEVLGTKFNVSAYPENPTVNSTLIEGSIQMAEVENKSNAVLLMPNQMATWQNNSKKITTKFVDTSIYAAWTKGDIAFKDTPFSTIAKIIERTYDVKIINENSDLARQNFTGSIKISESSVENILELLKRDTPFNYAIKENTITITNIP